MSSKLNSYVAKTRISVVKGDFLFAQVSSMKINSFFFRKIQPFACIYEGSSYTVVAPVKSYMFLKTLGSKTSKPYSLICFDVELPLELAGYFAKFSSVLAKNKISMMPFSSYFHDYVLVKKKDSKKAVSCLKSFIKSYRG